jgi:hypothetical protein
VGPRRKRHKIGPYMKCYIEKSTAHAVILREKITVTTKFNNVASNEDDANQS